MNVFDKVFSLILDKINKIIKTLNKLQIYVGSENSSDLNTISYKINFIFDNLYDYNLIQEDTKIYYDEDEDEYYSILNNKVIKNSNVYIKLYYRNQDSDGNETTIEEIAEIENGDYEINIDEIIFNKDIINEIGFKDDITYIKIIYLKRDKISIS